MSEELVEVYRTRGELAAQVVKNLLESAGIPCLFKSNAAPSVFPFTVNGMGEYVIMVRPEDCEEAKAILKNKENDISSGPFPEEGTTWPGSGMK